TSRVVHYSKDGEYLGQWGTKGSGDGEFTLVHDVAIDSRGLLYVTDRVNKRVQIFDQQGKFLGSGRILVCLRDFTTCGAKMFFTCATAIIRASSRWICTARFWACWDRLARFPD